MLCRPQAASAKTKLANRSLFRIPEWRAAMQGCDNNSDKNIKVGRFLAEKNQNNHNMIFFFRLNSPDEMLCARQLLVAEKPEKITPYVRFARHEALFLAGRPHSKLESLETNRLLKGVGLVGYSRSYRKQW